MAEQPTVDASVVALAELLNRFPVPRWAKLRLTHDADRLEDVRATMAAQFQRPGVGERIRPGMRVALTAGSRGVHRIAEVLAAAVAEIERRDGRPFIVPAMGSHGGATVAGQLEILARYGVTEQAMGCPIRATMDVVELGTLPSGEHLYTDRIVYQEADWVIPVNRVKPHTDFTGEAESGLLKMLAIGLGKQFGAESLHASGFENFPWLIAAAGRFLLERLPVPFGIATVENGYCELALLEAIPAADIPRRERELLDNARRRMATLPIDRLDVLVIDQIGKEISGAGMDPNVVGRYYDQPLPGGSNPQRIVVLDVTDATEGNATGVGMAEFCTQRLVDKIDWAKTYINQLTSKTPVGGRIPMVGRSDRETMQMALASLRRVDPAQVRLIRIASTKDLNEVWASAASMADLLASGRAERLTDLLSPAFDAANNLSDLRDPAYTLLHG